VDSDWRVALSLSKSQETSEETTRTFICRSMGCTHSWTSNNIYKSKPVNVIIQYIYMKAPSTTVRLYLASTSFGFTWARRHRSEKQSKCVWLLVAQRSIVRVCCQFPEIMLLLQQGSVWFNDDVRVGGLLEGVIDKQGIKASAGDRDGRFSNCKGRSEKTTGPVPHASCCTDSLKMTKPKLLVSLSKL
jgi:hypothetical protein